MLRPFLSQSKAGGTAMLRDSSAVVRIGSSVGAAVFRDKTQSITGILRCADVALYEAKTNRRGRLIAYNTPNPHRKSPFELTGS